MLAGGIAHDFNNILTGLFGNIELARMELPLKHAARTYLDSSTEALSKAKKLTKQLLTFSPGGAPLLEVVHLSEAVSHAARLKLIENSVIENISIEPHIWQVMMDKELIAHVITNLIINAKEAMPNGGKVTIDAENISRDAAVQYNLSGNFVKLSFTDEGTGIDENLLEKYITAMDKGRPFDILITDLTVPGGKGGKETIEELLNIDPTAKAIVVSGYSNNPVLVNYQDYGFKGRLTKPFRIAEMNTELSRVLELE